MQIQLESQNLIRSPYNFGSQVKLQEVDTLLQEYWTTVVLCPLRIPPQGPGPLFVVTY